MGEIIDKIKEKSKGVKDIVVDTTKDIAEKAKDMVDPSEASSSYSNSPSSTSNHDRKYEEGSAGTEVNRTDDSLREYREKEPMSLSTINEHEPTAVKRNSQDQKIISTGQTGTDTEKADEQYRIRGMTKIEPDSSNIIR